MSTLTNMLGYVAAGIAVIGTAVFVYNANHPTPDAVPAVAGESAGPLATAISEVVAKKATLIDVRTPAEFATGHARDAINFDSVLVEAGQLPDVAKDAKIYLYCHSGRRAGIVLSAMQAAGFTNVTNLGAFQSWLDAGGPKA